MELVSEANFKFSQYIKRKNRSFAEAKRIVQSFDDLDTVPARMFAYTPLQLVVLNSSKEWEKGYRYKQAAKVKVFNKRQSFDLKLVEFILNQGAAVDAVDSMGRTALDYAANGNSKIVALLLHHGASPNGGQNYRPPIFLSIHSVANTQLLLQAGADPNALSDSGESLSELVIQPDVVELLNEHGFSYQEASDDFLTSAQRGDLISLRKLAGTKKGDANAYQWLCIADDLGHKSASKLAEDLLESSSLRFDDTGFAQASAHAQIVLLYMNGTLDFSRENVLRHAAFIDEIVDNAAKVFALLGPQWKKHAADFDALTKPLD